MEYHAITFDTQVVVTNGFDFTRGLLDQLKQFAKGPYRVVVSRVVIAEIRSQLTEAVKKTTDRVKSSHRDALRFGLKSPGNEPFDSEPDAAAIATRLLDQYIKDIRAEVVSYDDVDLHEVMRLYFAGKPPFQKASI
jgi:hypothetical protein